MPKVMVVDPTPKPTKPMLNLNDVLFSSLCGPAPEVPNRGTTNDWDVRVIERPVNIKQLVAAEGHPGQFIHGRLRQFCMTLWGINGCYTRLKPYVRNGQTTLAVSLVVQNAAGPQRTVAARLKYWSTAGLVFNIPMSNGQYLIFRDVKLITTGRCSTVNGITTVQRLRFLCRQPTPRTVRLFNDLLDSQLRYDAVTEFTREKMREDGFYRRVNPPLRIEDYELQS